MPVITDIQLIFRDLIQDTETPYDVDPADTRGLLDKAYYAALSELARKYPHIDNDAVIVPNGLKYKYDLQTDLQVANDDTTVLTNFSRLRFITPLCGSGKSNPLIRHPSGMKYIRGLEAMAGGIISAFPYYYALQEQRYIYMDGILAAPADSGNPTAQEVVKIDYWAKPSGILTAGSFVIGREYIIRTTGSTNFTLIGADDSVVGTIFTATGAGSGTGTAATSTPDVPLDNGWDRLLLYKMAEQSLVWLRGDRAKEIRKDVYNNLPELEIEFESFINSLGYLDNSEGIEYSDMGSQVSGRGNFGITEAYPDDPWYG